MKCPSCRMKIPGGAKRCPYCGEEIDITHQVVGGASDDFKSGYKWANEHPGCSKLLAYPVIIVAGLYLIQRWIGIPLFDWLVTLVKWLFNLIS